MQFTTAPVLWTSSPMPYTPVKFHTRELPAEFTDSTLFCPEHPVAAVMLLHGAEGHPSLWVQGLATYFAQRQIAALYFAWYGSGLGLPRQIIDIPLSRTIQALHWLKTEFGLKTVLYGFSRGAEQAAIIASITGSLSTEFQAPDGLILQAGTHTINPALSWEWVASVTPLQVDAQELDFSAKPWRWDGSSCEFEVGTRITIEKYPGPVLLVHGTEDQTHWVAEPGYIANQLNKRTGQPPLVHELIIEGEGHILSPPAEKLLREAMVDFIVN